MNIDKQKSSRDAYREGRFGREIRGCNAFLSSSLQRGQCHVFTQGSHEASSFVIA